MKFVLLLAALASCAMAQAQVVDKPASPEDLRSEISEEKTRFEDQMQFLDQVTKTLRAAAGVSADPGNVAAMVHAGVMVCLTAGDHKRAVSRLYGRAGRHRDRPHPSVFANEAYNAPAVFPLLDVVHCQCRQFRPTQPAPEQRGEHGPVAQPLLRPYVRCVEQCLRLLERQPVPHPDAMRPDAFYPSVVRRK